MEPPVGTTAAIPNCWNADMTLEQANQVVLGPSWACACVGRPHSRCPYCWCQLSVGQAHAVRRAAHIAVKLLSEYAAARAQDI